MNQVDVRNKQVQFMNEISGSMQAIVALLKVLVEMKESTVSREVSPQRVQPPSSQDKSRKEVVEKIADKVETQVKAEKKTSRK